MQISTTLKSKERARANPKIAHSSNTMLRRKRPKRPLLTVILRLQSLH